MNESLCMPLAASRAFSPFGLVYVAIPVIVLLVAAGLASRQSGRPFWPIVCGAASAIVAVVLVVFISAQHPNGVLDRNLAVAADSAACLGAVLGAVAFRGLRRAGLAIGAHSAEITDSQ